MNMQNTVLIDIDLRVENAFNACYADEHIMQVSACPGWLPACR